METPEKLLLQTREIMGKGYSARKVNDVTIGRYNWRIEKQMKGGEAKSEIGFIPSYSYVKNDKGNPDSHG